MLFDSQIRGYGEIGKHAGFKIQCRKASRFKSEYPHQIKHCISYEIFFAFTSEFMNFPQIKQLSIKLVSVEYFKIF